MELSLVSFYEELSIGKIASIITIAGATWLAFRWTKMQYIKITIANLQSKIEFIKRESTGYKNLIIYGFTLLFVALFLLGLAHILGDFLAYAARDMSAEIRWIFKSTGYFLMMLFCAFAVNDFSSFRYKERVLIKLEDRLKKMQKKLDRLNKNR